MKRVLTLMVAAVLSISTLAGCTTKSAGGESVQSDGGLKIGVIFTEAGLGGQSFNDLVFEGVKRAKEELGVAYDYVEPKSVSDEEIVQEEMAMSEEYELIICVGAEQIDALTRVAERYPEQKFVLIDATLEMDNVASFVSKEHEGAFIVGALAALAKQEKITPGENDKKTVGFIGGVDNPLIRKFATGFAAGAKYIDKNYQVLTDFVGGFNDPTTAKVIAKTFYDKGADMIFHAAGASGMGLFQAAEENGFYAIGVNVNQNITAPDYVVASMLKQVDQYAYKAIEDVKNGVFMPGINALGLAEGGVGYTTEGSNITLPEGLLATLEEIKNKIIDGELSIPETLEEIDGFIASNQFQ